MEKTQNNDLFISPTNKSHKMDFFLVKKQYQRNQMSLALLRCVDWLILIPVSPTVYYQVMHCKNAVHQKPKVFTKYRNHWKISVSFQLTWQNVPFWAVVIFFSFKLKYPTLEGFFFSYFDVQILFFFTLERPHALNTCFI